jgi:hypothetical protein
MPISLAYPGKIDRNLYLAHHNAEASCLAHSGGLKTGPP